MSMFAACFQLQRQPLIILKGLYATLAAGPLVDLCCGRDKDAGSGKKALHAVPGAYWDAIQIAILHFRSSKTYISLHDTQIPHERGPYSLFGTL